MASPMHNGEPVLRREMRTMAPGGMRHPPHFTSAPHERYDNNTRIEHYKAHLLHSLKKRAADRGECELQATLDDLNKERASYGA